MERWEHEREIDGAQMRIGELEREREEILEFEREVIRGRNEFLSQLERKRSCIRRMNDVSNNGMALKVAATLQEEQNWAFERKVTDSFEGAHMRAMMLLQNLENNIAEEQSLIEGHLDALAHEE